ncbi:MAG: hypothetical protein GX133_07790, partial [Syntrophomonadaceae bacterium]|nr:hypothetical protein [Syntrophomonadaceae bacterium]
LERNKAERHLRGGEATRKKYAHESESLVASKSTMAATVPLEIP